MGITTDDLKSGNLPEGNITKGDERLIRMRGESHIEGRKPGKVFVVDSALANHYVGVLGVAEFVKESDLHAPSEAPPAEPEKPKTTDRAMRPPARGRRS